MKNVVISVLVVSTLIFFWEYTAVRQEYEISPSLVFNKTAHGCQWFFQKVGTSAAWVSSFLTMIDFEDVVKTFKRLLMPLWDICTSFLYLVEGYVMTMNVYDHPYLVTLGSLVLVTVILCALYYFNLLHHCLRVLMWLSAVVSFCVFLYYFVPNVFHQVLVCSSTLATVLMYKWGWLSSSGSTGSSGNSSSQEAVVRVNSPSALYDPRYNSSSSSTEDTNNSNSDVHPSRTRMNTRSNRYN